MDSAQPTDNTLSSGDFKFEFGSSQDSVHEVSTDRPAEGDKGEPVSTHRPTDDASANPDSYADSQTWTSRIDMQLGGADQDNQEPRRSARDERAANRERAKNKALCGQLLEQFHQDRRSVEKNVRDMSELVQRQPSNHAQLRTHKKMLEYNMHGLAQLVREIQDITPQPNIQEDFAVVSEAAASLLGKYRLIFPKPSPSAPSSDITSTVATEVSRRSAKEVITLALTKEAIAQEGEASAQVIEDQIIELHARMKDEQLQIESAKQEERRIREEARNREEEARRREEETRRKEEETRRKEEEIRRRKFEEDKEKARLRTEEIERQVKRRQEEVQHMIDIKRQEKETVIKKYKEKEWQVLTEFLTRDEPTDLPAAPPPNLPSASMVDLFLHHDKLGSIKSEVLDSVRPQPATTIASNTAPAPSPPQTTTLAAITFPATAAPSSPRRAAPAPRLLTAFTSAAPRQPSQMGPAIVSTAPYQSRQTVHPPGFSTVPYPPLTSSHLAHTSAALYLPQVSTQLVPTLTAPNPPLAVIPSFPSALLPGTASDRLFSLPSAAAGGELSQISRGHGILPLRPATAAFTDTTTAVSTSSAAVMNQCYSTPSTNVAPSFPPDAMAHSDPCHLSSILDPNAPPFPQPTPHIDGDQSSRAQLPVSLTVTDLSAAAIESVRCLANTMKQNRLPIQEPDIFSGDPMVYPAWRSAFALLIEKQNISEEEKLIYLQRYVSGPAKEAINGLFLLRSPAALKEALSILEQRFGSPFVVAQAFRDKLDSWPTVRTNDGEGLRKLADFARQTVVASKVVGQMTILDDAQYQKTLLTRLPPWMMRKWAQIADKRKRECLRYPTFEELATFLTSQADVACEPIFGTCRPQSAGKAPTLSTTSDKTKTSLNTQLSGAAIPSNPARLATRPCTYCKSEQHRVAACDKLVSKPLKERHDFFQKERLCYGCGIPNHIAKECKRRAQCHICKRSHPTIFHDPSKMANQSAGAAPPSKAVANRSAGDNSLNTTGAEAVGSQGSFACSLTRTTMIVPVLVSTEDDPSVEVFTYALLDTMSFISFISEEVSDQLKVRPTEATLSLNTMTSRNQMVKSGAVKKLRVRATNADEYVELRLAYTTRNLSVNTETIPTSDVARRYHHLRPIASELHPPQKDCTAGLLIGYDCAEALMPLEVIPGSPYAVRTKLGWSIVGETPPSDTVDSFLTSPTVVHVNTEPMPEPQNIKDAPSVSQSLSPVTVAHVYHTREATTTDVLKMMERDFVESELGRKSQDDVSFLRKVGEGIRVNEEGHYEMPLPFRHEDPILPDNRPLAVSRALLLKKQLEKNPTKKQHYIDFMQEVISEGHAEKVPGNSLNATPRWYIPHHGVYSDKKPNKIRVVFDCSAKYKGTCLNDQLLQGPDLINPLIGVLCRFRKGKIAFSCDVQKMYHQFHVPLPHRDYLRFLWWDGGDISRTIVDYRMKVHIFGATSSPGCANYGLKQLATDQEHISKDSAEFLRNDFYVDDGLYSDDDIDAAVSTLKGAMNTCRHGASGRERSPTLRLETSSFFERTASAEQTGGWLESWGCFPATMAWFDAAAFGFPGREASRRTMGIPVGSWSDMSAVSSC